MVAHKGMEDSTKTWEEDNDNEVGEQGQEEGEGW